MGVDEIVAFERRASMDLLSQLPKKFTKTEVNLHPDGDTFFLNIKGMNGVRLLDRFCCTK